MSGLKKISCLLGLVMATFLNVSCASGLSPIVIFPGDGGSRLEAKLAKENTVHFFCKKNSDWLPIWVDAGYLLPGEVDCWVDIVRMLFANGTFTNNTGVEIRTTGFGDTTAVEYLDKGTHSIGQYFNKFVDYFVNKGYVRGKSIRAAPYDWRLTPEILNQEGYYVQVVDLIQDTFAANNNTPVTLVAHSYGCPVSLYLLTQIVSQEWKDQYIHAYIPISGPWRGSAALMGTLASGANLGIVTVRPIWARPEQRTLPSSYYLLPTPVNDSWSSSDVFITSAKGNFTAYNVESFFNSLNFPEGYSMYKAVDRSLLMELPAPNVTTHCLYGNKMPTDYQYVYRGSNYPDKIDNVVTGQGDGTVNYQSLQACQEWKGKQINFYSKEIDGVLHFDLVSSQVVLDYINGVVMKTRL
jgi:lysophospholipase-3